MITEAHFLVWPASTHAYSDGLRGLADEWLLAGAPKVSPDSENSGLNFGVACAGGVTGVGGQLSAWVLAGKRPDLSCRLASSWSIVWLSMAGVPCAGLEIPGPVASLIARATDCDSQRGGCDCLTRPGVGLQAGEHAS